MILKHKNIFFALLAFMPLSILAQKRIVVEVNTKKPVKYAYVQSLETKEWTLSDSLGYFQANSNSGIKVKCMGYKTQTFQNRELKDTVFLTPKSEQLKQVVIQSNKALKTVEYGFHHSKRTWIERILHSKNITGAYGSKSDQFFSVYLENPKPGQKVIIKELLLKARALDKSAKIRLHVYSIKKAVNGKISIDKELLKKNFIIQISSKRKLKRISVENQHLIFPKNGVLLALEMFDDSNSIKFPWDDKPQNEPSKSYVIYSLKKNEPPHILLPFSEVKSFKNSNVMFGIEVTEY